MRQLLLNLRLLLAGGHARLRTSQVRLALHPRQRSLRQALSRGWPQAFSRLVRLAGEDTLFLDVGAQAGAATLLVARHSGAQVLAFEPHLPSFRHLAENILLNPGLNITPLNLALASHGGFLPIPASRFAASYQGASKPRPDGRREELQMAAAISLDEVARLYLDVCKPKRLLIRLDAGHQELEILRGGTGLLSSSVAMAICSAFHSPENLFEIKDFLSVYGFHPFEPPCSPKLRSSSSRGSREAFFANEAWAEAAAAG